jgi:hypothetical protein
VPFQSFERNHIATHSRSAFFPKELLENFYGTFCFSVKRLVTGCVIVAAVIVDFHRTRRAGARHTIVLSVELKAQNQKSVSDHKYLRISDLCKELGIVVCAPLFR